ncbi:ETS-related transcription factor Elf-3-like isoform X2 [Neocloeon triangulifer]|uniref:ETS-related transcription factor Elf-3-like isoform X2 n=1 Tax=Neocloeon triangulifer TaxID=2078957 RepID=UPI00286F586D|nr:ETS-related transcription factor Elf-3-like isoform X2 [Neocloeon triangulifer]
MPPVECTSLVNGAQAPQLQALSPLVDEFNYNPFFMDHQQQVFLSSAALPEHYLHHNLNMNFNSADSYDFSFDQNYPTSNDNFHPNSFETETSSIFKSSCDVLEGKDTSSMSMPSTANCKEIPLSSLEIDTSEYDKKPDTNNLWNKKAVVDWFVQYGADTARLQELQFSNVSDLYRMLTNDIEMFAEKLGISAPTLQKACDELYSYNPHSSGYIPDGHVFNNGNHEMLHEVKQESSSQMDYPWAQQGYSYKDDEYTSEDDAEDFEQEKPAVQVPRRTGKRGRPPSIMSKAKRREKSHGKLWEFIRDLLKEPKYCPSLICWENHEEGVFRFVSSEKVAKLWGDKRKNSNMTYEKLSRAMRYYYKSKILQPVTHRRLVYKFGPNAVNWRCENPNFARLS